ncbi:MAG: phenylalanine--tRNA ligase subunit alpha [Holosporales bacterium]|jgi:phenylalanyl-tRNA synthetase alpha chain|nr:phenylalanine--tRNA ligase subunit alpha [Holosporales bacterium]
MSTQLESLKNVLSQELAAIALCSTMQEIESKQTALFGKNGSITQEMKKLVQCEDLVWRKELGSALNSIRKELESALRERSKAIEQAFFEQKLKSEFTDVTLPERPQHQGRLHMLTQICLELLSYFRSRGFKEKFGPELETDFNNFEALNFPPNHPARQEQDTFYIRNHPKKLLRTHTSTIQIRTLSSCEIPIRAVSFGSVFRDDAVDATHSPVFHQMEFFVVEPGTTVAHLKYCLLDFLGFLFRIDLLAMDANGDAPLVRLRPSFFPFTEPSLEVDVCCSKHGGKLKLDKNGDWLEIMGCGMIHPNVYKSCGLSTFPDGSPLQGFAAGIGIERVAMLRHGVTDIRNFYDGDMRWLDHYGAVAAQ